MSIILYTNSISDESATEEKIKVATTYTTTYIEQLLEKSVKMGIAFTQQIFCACYTRREYEEW